MAKFTVGCVPYINAIPLVFRLEQMGISSPVRVLYEVPSKLPELLGSGRVDAILVSSYDALTKPHRRIVPGVCVGSFGAVESVRLFSKVPLERIATLALDASSMTSNALAQVVLANRYGVRPTVTSMLPDLNAMLDSCDACVLIGDIGMGAHAKGCQVIDLGQEWSEMTGLPFVWAAWIGGEQLTPELTYELMASYADVHGNDLEEMIDIAVRQSPFSRERIRRYFAEAMRYDLDDLAKRGLDRFGKEILGLGLASKIYPIVECPATQHFAYGG